MDKINKIIITTKKKRGGNNDGDKDEEKEKGQEIWRQNVMRRFKIGIWLPAYYISKNKLRRQLFYYFIISLHHIGWTDLAIVPSVSCLASQEWTSPR